MPNDEALDPLIDPLREHVSGARWAEIVAAAATLGPGDPHSELAGLRHLDLLTADEEDLVVGLLVAGLAVDLRASPTPAEVTDRVLHLLENQFRCRVPAVATVIAPLGELPFDPADPAAGSFVTVEVGVEETEVAGRFQLSSPCQTDAQRELLSTPGNQLPVRISARDPGRIMLDLDQL